MQLKYGELRSCCDHVGHHAGTNIIVLLIWKLTKFKALVAVGDQSTIKSLICIRKSRFMTIVINAPLYFKSKHDVVFVLPMFYRIPTI